jgi:SAM-dependent methyltransferase
LDRVARLRGAATHATRIVEIGASYTPIAPKSGGWNSFVIDHASREDLRQKYAGDGVAGKLIDAIEEVDAVWQGGDIHAAVAETLLGSFDLLIASHVIEHIPDFVSFLISAQRLLKPTGLISFAVPDRRFCFDYFKPNTSTGDLLEAYRLRRSRHSLRSVWDQVAYAALHHGVASWGQSPLDSLEFATPFAHAEATYRSFNDDVSLPYQDCHVWRFTPAGFALAILELGQLGLIDWHIDASFGPAGNEFFVCLARGAERFTDEQPLQARRMQLLREQLAEWEVQLGFIAGFLPQMTRLPAAAASLPPSPPPPSPLPPPARAAASGAPREGRLLEIAELLRTQQARVQQVAISPANADELRRLADALAKAERGVRAQQTEDETLRSLLEQRSIELARTQEELAVRNADLRMAQSRMASVNALSDRFRMERDIILASRSWRLAAPLRVAGRALRSLTGGWRNSGMTSQSATEAGR